MTDLMGNHISLGKIARRTHLGSQIMIKTQVDIDFAVGGTIKWSHGRLSKSTGRFHRTGKKYKGWFFIPAASLTE